MLIFIERDVFSLIFLIPRVSTLHQTRGCEAPVYVQSTILSGGEETNGRDDSDDTRRGERARDELNAEDPRR